MILAKTPNRMTDDEVQATGMAVLKRLLADTGFFVYLNSPKRSCNSGAAIGDDKKKVRVGVSFEQQHEGSFVHYSNHRRWVPQVVLCIDGVSGISYRHGPMVVARSFKVLKNGDYNVKGFVEHITTTLAAIERKNQTLEQLNKDRDAANEAVAKVLAACPSHQAHVSPRSGQVEVRIEVSAEAAIAMLLALDAYEEGKSP